VWELKLSQKSKRFTKDVLLILRGNDAGGKKVYVGNLSTRAHERDLEEVFSKYGEIDDIYIPRFALF